MICSVTTAILLQYYLYLCVCNSAISKLQETEYRKSLDTFSTGYIKNTVDPCQRQKENNYSNKDEMLVNKNTKLINESTRHVIQNIDKSQGSTDGSVCSENNRDSIKNKYPIEYSLDSKLHLLKGLFLKNGSLYSDIFDSSGSDSQMEELLDCESIADNSKLDLAGNFTLQNLESDNSNRNAHGDTNLYHYPRSSASFDEFHFKNPSGRLKPSNSKSKKGSAAVRSKCKYNITKEQRKVPFSHKINDTSCLRRVDKFVKAQPNNPNRRLAKRSGQSYNKKHTVMTETVYVVETAYEYSTLNNTITLDYVITLNSSQSSSFVSSTSSYNSSVSSSEYHSSVTDPQICNFTWTVYEPVITYITITKSHTVDYTQSIGC